MKDQGFVFVTLPLLDAVKKYSLPLELGLWGTFSNLNQVNYDRRAVYISLLFYYDDVVAGITFFEKRVAHVIAVASSPHGNAEIQFGHIYMKNLEGQRDKEHTSEVFVKELTGMIRKRNYLSFHIAFPKKYMDMRAWQRYKWSIVPSYTYILHIALIRRLGLREYIGKKLRNIIKNTSTELAIRRINARDFYACYQDTYARQRRKAPHPLAFFSRLGQMPNYSFFGAFAGKRLTSGMVFCEYGDTSYYITSGVKHAFSQSNGTTFLLYDHLRSLIDNPRIKYLDLYGANTKKISYFKAIFNPRVQLYFSAYYRPLKLW